jgi:poly [ADP-ribose] polymerase 6/8
MMSYAIDKLMTCVDNCMICDKRLAFSMLKPSICDDALCLFSHEQFGLGVDPAAEIAAHPEVVDMLISCTMAAAVGGDCKRFTPFPAHLEVKWKEANGKEVTKRYQAVPTGDPTNNDLLLVKGVIDKFPSVTEMARWPTTQELKTELDRRDHMCYPLLRWILTSTRAHLERLKPGESIQALNSTKHQYLLLSSPPAKERKFQEEKKKHGSFLAFHGSAFPNWHSILRNGLKNLSGTALMTTGAVYGNGIYMAADSNTSIGYARSGVGWEKSIYNEGGNSNLQLLALCEVINAGYKANPYYVVANEDHVITRYLFLFNNRNTHRNVLNTSVNIPQLEYFKYNKSY